ncbi:arsenate reductase ArsC [Deefgea rivuli]|uniref:arsenate reductase ArsC n=1 Tax=Deefgea rivuli TaxID=400948 RepID=UPI000487A15C|nr:arsenate reductase ArsC [Deefgea rivuli]
MKHYNILFICTANASRSQMAEALVNHYAHPNFTAYSAGSHPAGQLHPLTLVTLQHFGLATASLRSKSWDEFLTPNAPPMDFIFTLCDAAAGESCPTWPGLPLVAHWGVADPSLPRKEEDRHKAFHDAFLLIKHRIDLLTALPFEKLEHLALQHHIRDIGVQTPKPL